MLSSCGQCGSTVLELGRFCPNCGQAVQSPVQPSVTQRKIHIAGRDIVADVTVEGNLIIQQPAASRRDRVDEYSVEFRGVLDHIQGVRDWLAPDERHSLNERALLLGLRSFQQHDAEAAVLTALRMQLRDRPSDLWWVASTSAHLVKEMEFAAAVQALAGLLDSHDPGKLFASSDHGATWRRLPLVSPLFDEARRARGVRFQQGLIEWVRHGQLTAGVANLHQISRGLSNQEIQAVRREAETTCAKQVTIPPLPWSTIQAQAATTPPPAKLDGTWEAQSNPAVRVVIKDGLVRMKTTAPFVRAGQARIIETKREGDQFGMTVHGIDGDLKTLRAITGTVTEGRLVMAELDGDIPAPLAEAFATSYRRI